MTQRNSFSDLRKTLDLILQQNTIAGQEPNLTLWNEALRAWIGELEYSPNKEVLGETVNYLVSFHEQGMDIQPHANHFRNVMRKLFKKNSDQAHILKYYKKSDEILKLSLHSS